MEDQRLQRSRVAAEIVSTEKSYVDSLSVLIELYIKPLNDNPKLLGPEDAAKIFTNIELIYDLNLEFSQQLESSLGDLQQLGNLFLKYLPYFKMYISYCNGHSQAVSEYRQHLEKKESLRQFEQNAMKNPKTKGLSLES